ncbi:hypothetical protein GN956_G3539 [Arapaima gigas]
MNKKVDYLAFPATVGTPGQYSKMRRQMDSENYRLHLNQMETAKPVIDNKAPKRYVHDQPNTKKLEREQQRLKEVQRENWFLASKIKKITASKGSLDNWNNYQRKSSGYFDRWNQELERISLANQAMLKKMNSIKSDYDHDKLTTDYEVTREYMARLTKYPEDHS